MNSRQVISGILGIICVAASHGPTFGAESLEAWDAYRAALTERHVKGDAASAQQALMRARGMLRDTKSDLATLISSEEMVLAGDQSPVIQLAAKFLTGRKEEIYCRGVGLVQMKGWHNDGTRSSLILKKNHRQLSDDYAWISSGSWVYELTNGYRETVDSEMVLLESGASMFKIKELRRGKLKDDTGEFRTFWEAGKKSASFSTTGQVFEPVPMFMAMDFHLWGNDSLGRELEFREGFTHNNVRRLESAHGRTFVGDIAQVVSKKLPEVTTKDAAGVERSYEDCYQVDITIGIKAIEDNRAKSDEKSKSVIKKTE